MRHCALGQLFVISQMTAPPHRPLLNTLDGLAAWPYDVLDRLKQSGREQFNQFIENVQNGLEVTTAYSGMDTPLMALGFLIKAAIKLELLPEDVLAQALHVRSACDKKSVARQVLVNHEPEVRARHCFQDLNDFLMPSVRTLLNTVESAEHAMQEAKQQGLDLRSDSHAGPNKEIKCWYAHVGACVYEATGASLQLRFIAA